MKLKTKNRLLLAKMTSFDNWRVKPNWTNNYNAIVTILGLKKFRNVECLNKNKDLIGLIVKMLSAEHAAIIRSNNGYWINYEKTNTITVEVEHFESGDALKSPKTVIAVSSYTVSSIKNWSTKRCNETINNYWSWLACKIKIQLRKDGWRGRAHCAIYEIPALPSAPNKKVTIAMNLDNDKRAIDAAPIFQ